MSLDQALKKFVTNDKILTTHTKIGNTELNIFGNKYSITKENEKKFYDIYQKHVFEKQCEAYMTEKQLELGKIAIDLDFRYDPTISSRQHTKEHIDDFVEMMNQIIHELFMNLENQDVVFHVFEKPNVNICDGKTKDGIHMIINILCDFPMKMMIRDKIIDQLEDIWDDLPIKNTWKDVVDEGVMKGSVNWQLYGSKKPGCESYQLKYIYRCKSENQHIQINHVDPAKVDFDFKALCIRNVENCYQGILQRTYEEQYQKKKKECGKKQKSTSIVQTKSLNQCSSVNDMLKHTKNSEELNQIIKEMLEDATIDQKYKEVHQYTMTLPQEFWGPGSYSKWIQVGWALKNMKNEIMRLTWYLFCSQSSDFDFDYNDALEQWDRFDIYNKDGLSYRSIVYWSKTTNYEEYMKIYKKTIDYYID